MKKLFFLTVINLLVLTMFPVTRLVAQEKTILNIAAYHPGYNWTDTCVQGIEEGLGKKYNLINYYMDTKRLPKDKHQEATEKAWQMYLKLTPDLVMLGDDNALNYIGTRLAGSKIPVVFYGVNANPRSYFSNNKIPKNITGVLERPLFIQFSRHLKEIIPNLKNILFLIGDSPTSKIIIKTSFYGKETLRVNGVTIALKSVSTFKTWQNMILHPGELYDVILLGPFFTLKDEKGTVVDSSKILKWTSANTSLPLFGSLELMTASDGVIGSLVIVGEKHGQLAAEIADNILQEKRPESFYVMDKEGRFVFNKQQMARFKITLPQEIKNKTVFK